ncbi:hypothetical protein SRHO_G00227140 [Serrasalmus rhombeus]
MTADQVSKGMPDDLLSSDTCTIQPPLVAETSVHEETSHALDQQTQTLHNISATMLIPNLDNIAEIQATDIQEETERGNVLDLVLVQPPVQTISMMTNRLNIAEGDEVNVGNLDLADVAQVGKDCASNSRFFTQASQEGSKDEDITVTSQPPTNLYSDPCDVSESITGPKGIMETAIPENAVSQDDVICDCGSTGISESQSLSKTILTGLPMIPEHHDAAAETMTQNSDQNCLDLTYQENKVLENSQSGENAISNKKEYMLTVDQSSSGHLNRESSTVGDMPDSYFETEDVQDVMTGVDSVDQGETVCNTDTETTDVIHADKEVSGIVGETVCNANHEISGITQETACHTESEINDSTKGSTFNSDPEVGEEMFSCITSITHESHAASITSKTAGEPIPNTDSETHDILGEIISQTNYKASGTTDETLHNSNIIEEAHTETVCNIGSEKSYIFGETVSDIATKTDRNCDYGMKGILAETNDTNPVPEVPVIQEPLYKLVVELNKPDTVCASPVLRPPVTQPSSIELNDNNLDGQCRALTFDQAIADPNAMQGDSLADSAANLLENVLTQTTQNLVTESSLDMVVSESCLLGDPVLDRSPALLLHQLEPKAFSRNDQVVDNTAENNSDTHLLFPGFLNTSIEIPQISEEAGTDLPLLDICSTPAAVQESSCRGMEDDLSNELWMDACQFLTIEEDKESIYDEWGHSPIPSPCRVSPNITKSLASSQGRGAVIGQLGDWELPPVERWSSSDSWASALSDWFQTVSVFAEDRPLAATATSSSNPLDSQPQPCMAVQDTTEQQKDSPESCSTTGQMCLPPSSTEAEVDAQRQRVPRDEETLLQLAEKDMHLHVRTQDLPGESVDTQEERKMEVETVNPSGACMQNLGSHVQDVTMAPVMPMKDFTAGKLTNQRISGTKLDSDGIQEVAEDRTFQLSADFEEESVRNSSPLKFSSYLSNKDTVVGCACGPCLDTHAPHLDRHVPSERECLTQAKGVETPHTEESWSHACFYTQDPETSQGQSRFEDPEFIMPFAPVSIGTSFHHPFDLKAGQPSPKTSTKPSLIGNIDEIKGCLPTKIIGKVTSGQELSDDQFCTCSEKSSKQSSSGFGDSEESSSQETQTEIQNAGDISHELSKLILFTGQRFIVSEEKRVAYVTLDLDDVNFIKEVSDVSCDQRAPSFPKQHNCEEHPHIKDTEMPHKTPKTSSEGKTRSKHKEKITGQQLGTATKKQEKVQPEGHVANESLSSEALSSEPGTVTVIETIVITEKIMPKPQGKKKKKHGMAKPESEPLAEVENGARPKATKATCEGAAAKPAPKPGKVKEKPALPLISTLNTLSTGSPVNDSAMKCKGTEAIKANTGITSCGQESQSTGLPSVLDDDLIKRRRISGEKSEAVPIRTRPQLPTIFRQKKEEEVGFKRAYSDVVKQKIQTPKEVVAVVHVVAEIQADPVPDDPQSISLWCQFSPLAAETSITWTKEGKVLSEKKRGAGDESRVTLSIVKACSKDLGMYCCNLTSRLGSVSTSDYHLTSEVLMELVIPSHDTPAERREVDGEEEDVQCAPLLFRGDILTDQYFGENQSASIVTEKAHFGEGMHRKAFRTTLRAGMLPVFNPGHPCVLKVHNAISYGTNNNDELIEKNYNLAVEECHVQNMAREYIKAYTNATKSAESFGEVPEIIPIYLVHRPSNDIPYATLEEELIGDFVKYSVKDGKEINLMRRDSEAGQKCCAFQHWVYAQTDGNLLVTDMQGVGMKLTDVGIATCRKGYKGFKGNCATSFIDQFKALHQCNRFCELLGLPSLQPKPKRTVAPPKPKAQPVPKKKTFGPVLKGKS